MTGFANSAVAAGLLLLIAAANVHAHGHAAHEKPGAGFQRLEVDQPAARFELVNQDGRRVTLKDLRGKVVILTFMYTHCTDVCPILIESMKGVEQRLGDAERASVRFVGVTVDPRRDTPARLKAFMKERGLDAARWQLLTGSIKEATRAATDYGVVVRPDPHGDFVHNSVYVLVDRNGRDRVEFHGMATPVATLTESVRKLLRERPVKR
ncbi:MAG: SCO family protein [Betaproteobacteria bacterium]|nr:SCO family protein [Betaproteobacteria bacterium]